MLDAGALPAIELDGERLGMIGHHGPPATVPPSLSYLFYEN